MINPCFHLRWAPRKHNNLEITTLGWGPDVSIIYYTRIGSGIKMVHTEATLGHVNWGVVYPKSSYKIGLPIHNRSLNCFFFVSGPGRWRNLGWYSLQVNEKVSFNQPICIKDCWQLTNHRSWAIWVIVMTTCSTLQQENWRVSLPETCSIVKL